MFRRSSSQLHTHPLTLTLTPSRAGIFISLVATFLLTSCSQDAIQAPNEMASTAADIVPLCEQGCTETDPYPAQPGRLADWGF
jgi:hypothetical protein